MWLIEEIREKFDIVGTYRRIKGYAQTYGLRFVVIAAVWEFIESVVAPLISWKMGHPELIPVFIVFHAEPIVYPMFLYAFRCYDRVRGYTRCEKCGIDRRIGFSCHKVGEWDHGIITLDPHRNARSSPWRSGLKVALYRFFTISAFWGVLSHLNLGLTVLTFYTLAMTFFAFIHERIWHQSNWGIAEDDTVAKQRTAVKAITYRFASVVIMTGLFMGFMHKIPWEAIITYQAIAVTIYVALELFWSRNTWGIKNAA